MLKRKRNWLFLILLSLVCVLFGWRDIVGVVVKGIVRSELGCRLAYRDLTVGRGLLVIEDPVLFDIASPKSAFHVKADRIVVNWRLKGKKIEANISVLRPHVTIGDEVASRLSCLNDSRYLNASIEAERGTFEWKRADAEPLFGRFELSETLKLDLQGGHLAVAAMRRGEVRHLVCTMEQWPLVWAGGTMSGSLHLDVMGKRVLRAVGELSARDFSLKGEKWKVSAERLSWEGDYEPIETKAEGWMEAYVPQMIAHHGRFLLQCSGASIGSGGSALEGLEAEASYTRDEGARWSIKNESFSCEGKGFFQSRFADWVEGEFRSGLAKCRVHLSDDGSGSIFLEQADAALAQLVSDLSMREWPIRWKTGQLSGHAEWDGKGSWKGEVIESADLCLAGDRWEWGCRSGAGRIAKYEAVDASIHFEDGYGKMGPFAFEEGRCDVEINHDIIRSAAAAARLNGLALEMRGAGTLANAEADAIVKGAWADYWSWHFGKEVSPHASEIVASAWHFRKDASGIDGSVRCSFSGDEMIEATCAVTQDRGAFRLKKGEARAKGIDLSRFSMFRKDLWGKADGVLSLQGDESGRVLAKGAWEGLVFAGEGICDLDGEKNFSFRSTLEGNVAVKGWKGCGQGQIQMAGALSRPSSEWKWQAQGRWLNGSFERIDNLRGEWIADSERGLIELSDFKGELNVGGIQSPLRVAKLRRDGNGWSFDVRLEQGLWDAARGVGRIEKREDGFDVQFDPAKSHCYSIPLLIEECQIGLDGALQSLHLKPRLEGKAVANALRLWKGIEMPLAVDGEGILEIDFQNQWSIRFCGENCTTELQSADAGWILELKQPTASATCRLSREENRWRIEEGRALWENGALHNIRGVFEAPDHLELKIGGVSGDLKSVALPFPLEGKVEGSAELALRWNQGLSYEANFDLEAKRVKAGTLEIENQGPMHVQISSEEGVNIRGLDFSVKEPEAHIRIAQLHCDWPLSHWTLSRAQLKCPAASLSIFRDRMEMLLRWIDDSQSIDLSADIDCAADFSSFSCGMREGFLPFAGAVRHLQNVNLVWEERRCHLQMQALHQGHSLRIDMAADFDTELSNNKMDRLAAPKPLESTIANGVVSQHTTPFAIVDSRELSRKPNDPFYCLTAPTVRGRLILDDEEANLSEEERPLQIDGEYDPVKGLAIESIAGNFGGIDASFHADGAGLIGSAHVDFGLLSDILPPALSRVFRELKIGPGYELKGRLSLSPLQFKGLVSGKQCELCGFQIRTLLSQLEIGAKRVRIFDLKASDSSGILKIDDLILSQNGEEPWRIDMPFLRLFEFRPSLLQKMGREAGPVGPLVVRKGELRDFQGQLDDSSTYTAKGELTFINSFKREHSVFDLPSDFFGRIIGLDVELLIPVQGRIEFDLRERRFWLTDLHDAYSQGERSKFFLVQSGLSPSIGLDGDLNILVKMKQYVLFKITEHFLLLVDGTLDKPSYHFQKKSKFLGIGL